MPAPHFGWALNQPVFSTILHHRSTPIRVHLTITSTASVYVQALKVIGKPTLKFTQVQVVLVTPIRGELAYL